MQEEYFHTLKEEWDEEKKKTKHAIKKKHSRRILKTIIRKETLIITLLAITYLLTLQDGPIKKINETTDGEYVTIKGEIIKCTNTDHLTIINLTDETGSINTVLFKNTACNKGINKVTGRIGMYEQEKELKAIRIEYIEGIQ